MNPIDKDTWRAACMEVSRKLNERADKLSTWMRSERIGSELRQQLSMRAGELYEAVVIVENMAQETP